MLLARLLLVSSGQMPCCGALSSGQTQAIFSRGDGSAAADPGQNGRKVRSMPTGRPIESTACAASG